MADRDTRPLTELLEAAGRGDRAARDEFVRLVHEELRVIARRAMARRSPGASGRPTSLVNDAYLRLVGRDPGWSWENRRHFFFTAARAMRDILVEQARRNRVEKEYRGGRRCAVENLTSSIEAPADDLLALDEALRRLEEVDQRKHDVVVLRFFGGLTQKQVAEVLDVSVQTVQRDWRFSRARLRRDLDEVEPVGSGDSPDEP